MELFKINESFWSIRKNQNVIVYELDSVRFPFGLEQSFNHYLLKIEITPEIEAEIIQLEQEILEITKQTLDEPNLQIKSQIQYGKRNYPNLLISKIYMKKKQIKTTVNYERTSTETNHLTIFDIGSSAQNINLFIDNLFIRNNKIYYKWKISTLRINK